MSDPATLADLVQLSYRYAAGVDRRDWELFATCFADPCWIDMSSFSGRPGGFLPVADWVERVRGVNGEFDATQHLMSNHRILDAGPDGVVVEYEMQAQHWFRPETMADLGAPDAVNWCLLGGHYTCLAVPSHDRGWVIGRLRLDVRWRTGNMGVFDLARARHR